MTYKNRRRPPRSPRVSLPGIAVSLSLASVGIGCDPETEEAFEAATEEDGDLDEPILGEACDPGAASGDYVLVLSGEATSAPVLGVLSDAVDTVGGEGNDLASLVESATHARALTVDLAVATREQLDGWGPVFEAARVAHVPIVFEHVDEAAAMAGVLGFGIEAEAVVAESLAPTPGYRLRVFGSHGEDLDGAPTEAGTETKTEPEAVLEAQAIEPETVADIVLEAANDYAPTPASPKNGQVYPPGSHAKFIVDHWNSWSPYDGQTATLDVDFTVELFASVDSFGQPEKKWLVVGPAGSGAHPGSLLWDDYDDRGYFQESIGVHVRPLHYALHAFKHAPLTDNVSSTFTTSTQMTTAVTASYPPALSVGFSEGTSSSINLQSFGVLDDSVGRSSKWEYRMTATGSGTPYDEPTDLVDYVSLHGLPALAKSTLAPKFETVYWADGRFEDLVALHLQADQTLRNTWMEVPWFGVSTTKSKWAEVWGNAAVDFSVVGTPDQGTLRFEEAWVGSPVPDRWDEGLSEGVYDDSQWTISPGSSVRQTGNAWGFGPDGLPRGAYMRAHSTFFGRGSVSVPIRPHDDDTWGLMYSMQDDANYYRAEVDKERDRAWIVKVEDGVHTVLASASAPAIAVGSWHDLRVERQGTSHKLFVDDTLVVSAYDSDYDSGPVALYTWAMQDVEFGPVEVRGPYVARRNVAAGREVWGVGNMSPLVDGGTDMGYGSNIFVSGYDHDSWSAIIDLGEVRPIDEVVLWGSSPYLAIQVLGEDLAWVSYQWGYPSGNGNPYDFGGVEGRYIKLLFNQSGWYFLSEAEVFESAD